ncbi:hypothetical protein J3F83DRAFT_716295 [Trichoderma novae-zelandiae]
MSLFAQIRGGLASAQLEVSRHINAASIHRVIENAQSGVEAGTAGISHLRYLATGYEAQTPAQQQSSTGNATAAQDGCPHVEITMTAGCEQGPSEVRDAFPSADTVGEQCACACSCDDGPQRSKANGDGAGNGFMDGARRLRDAAWENPMLAAGTVAAGAGILAAAAPIVVTAPILGLAGTVGFTPAGIAASSLASGIHAGIGSIGAGSLFATVQSAAMGGYGAAVLTGATQAAGGAVAGAGALVALVSRKSEAEQSKEQPSDEKTSGAD